MKKKDILEIKRRLKKEEVTITRMCGCYVDCNKNQVVKINENFLNLDDEEFYKYLEIARKTLSGNVGNNLLQLPFASEEEESGGKQQFFLGIRESGLKNEALLDRFYELIIENYQYVGNYLILLFHDAYDVMTKTTDNNKLDESEEVYEYLLCAICPVALSKPGLGYIESENRIGPRMRDWVVGAPETGFIFPAFSDRSADVHSLIYFTKNVKDPHPEFMENALGCTIRKTVAEKKETFQSIIKTALGNSEENSEDVMMEIQESLNSMIEEQDVIYDKDRDPIVLTSDTLQEVMKDSDIPEEIAVRIEQAIAEEFEDELPTAEDLVDAKAITANAQKKREKELVAEVHSLKQQLSETAQTDSEEKIDVTSLPSGFDNIDSEELDTPYTSYDIVLNINPEKLPKVASQIIDGQKYLIIPVEEDEVAKINGNETSL